MVESVELCSIDPYDVRRHPADAGCVVRCVIRCEVEKQSFSGIYSPGGENVGKKARKK